MKKSKTGSIWTEEKGWSEAFIFAVSGIFSEIEREDGSLPKRDKTSPPVFSMVKVERFCLPLNRFFALIRSGQVVTCTTCVV